MEIGAPMAGETAVLCEVGDAAFATGILGKGIAIRPNEGCVTAPCDGVVDVIFETGHAVSMTTGEGADLLIHVGIDTVKLNGRYFRACCAAGDRVKKGQLLIEFDMDAIKAEGYDTITPIVVCNSEKFSVFKKEAGAIVAQGDTILEIEA